MIQMNSLVNVSHRKTIKDPFISGFFIKPEQVTLDSSVPGVMQGVYNEMSTASCIKGMKVNIGWGDIEYRDEGVPSFNISKILEWHDACASMNKYLILTIVTKDYKTSRGASKIVPIDLNKTIGMYNDDVFSDVPLSDNYWCAKKTNDQISSSMKDSYSYNIALEKKEVMNRLDYFFASLAKYVDKLSHLSYITISDTFVNDAISSTGLGNRKPIEDNDSPSLHEEGLLSAILMIKKYFKHTGVFFTMGNTRHLCKKAIPILIANKIGFSTTGTNLGFELNREAPIELPGILTYYNSITDKIFTIPEISCDDFMDTEGNTTRRNLPHPAILMHNALRLNPNSIILQRYNCSWFAEGTITSNDDCKKKDQNGNVLQPVQHYSNCPEGIFNWLANNVDEYMNIKIVHEETGLNYVGRLNNNRPSFLI